MDALNIHIFMCKKSFQRWDLKQWHTEASSKHPNCTLTAHFGLPVLSCLLPCSLIQLTNRWWPVDSFAPFFQPSVQNMWLQIWRYNHAAIDLMSQLMLKQGVMDNPWWAYNTTQVHMTDRLNFGRRIYLYPFFMFVYCLACLPFMKDIQYVEIFFWESAFIPALLKSQAVDCLVPYREIMALCL